MTSKLIKTFDLFQSRIIGNMLGPSFEPRPLPSPEPDPLPKPDPAPIPGPKPLPGPSPKPDPAPTPDPDPEPDPRPEPPSPPPPPPPPADPDPEPTVTGTDGIDDLDIDAGLTDEVFLLGGNDRLDTTGVGDIYVEAGDGEDSVKIDNTGTAEVHAGADNDSIIAMHGTEVTAFGDAGDDVFKMYDLGNHHFDGGTGWNTLNLNGIGADADGTGQYLRMKWDATGFILSENGSTGPKTTFANVDEVIGTLYDDAFWSHSSTIIDDVFRGLAGNDTMYGYKGDDIGDGGDGNDRLFMGEGDDTALGGDGDDYIKTDEGEDFIEGGLGNDIVSGGDGNDQIDGGDGNDVVDGDEGNDIADLGDGDDLFRGGDGNDTGFGGDGNDSFTMGNGDDSVDAGAGDDVVHAFTNGHSGGGNDHYDGGTHSAGDLLRYADFNGGIVMDTDAGTAHANEFGHDQIGQDTFTGFEAFTLSRGNDHFTGSDADENVGLGLGDDVYMGSAGWDHANAGMGVDTIDFSNVNVSLLVNLDGFVRATDANGATLWEQTAWNFEHSVGGQGNDTMVSGESTGKSMNGGDGDDTLIKYGTGKINFVFQEIFGNDTVEGFGNHIDSVLEFRDVKTLDGQTFDDFDDLDSNGDGVVDGNDLWASQSGDDLTLQLLGGSVTVEDEDTLMADDFIFA